MSDDGYFGEEIAANYDADTSGMHDDSVIAAVVDVLAGLACDGAALEFGIGTGRIALPLARRGVEVHGIDLSKAMVARMRDKPGGAEIDVTIGDFAQTRVPGEFSLAYLVFNTINNLTTQDEQVACFVNAADAFDAGRKLRHRGRRARAATAAAGPTGRSRSTSARSTGPTTCTTARRKR